MMTPACGMAFHFIPIRPLDRGHGRQGLGRTGPSLVGKLFVGDFGLGFVWLWRHCNHDLTCHGGLYVRGVAAEY